MYHTEFMTLQNNASLKLFPNNTASHFIVKLPNYVQYNHKTRLGLAEIHASLKFAKPVTSIDLIDPHLVNTSNDDDTNANTDANVSVNLNQTVASDTALDDSSNSSSSVNRVKRSAPISDVGSSNLIPTPLNSDMSKRSRDVNYEATIIELRNNFLSSYEYLRRSLDSCRSSIRQSELLQECGSIIVSKFNESIENLKSEENVLSIYLASLDNAISGHDKDKDVSGDTRSPEREVFTKIQTKITEVSHLKDHLIVEFLDFIKVLQKENKEHVQNIIMTKNEEKDYWKNNFIGLSYSAFSNTKEKNEIHIPKYLYVYCDIVEKRYVGDSFSPLLRVVRVPPIRMNGDTATVKFDNPHFMSLSKKSFDCIEIYITDEKGDLVSFDDGKVIITLQFQTPV